MQKGQGGHLWCPWEAVHSKASNYHDSQMEEAYTDPPSFLTGVLLYFCLLLGDLIPLFLSQWSPHTHLKGMQQGQVSSISLDPPWTPQSRGPVGGEVAPVLVHKHLLQWCRQSWTTASPFSRLTMTRPSGSQCPLATSAINCSGHDIVDLSGRGGNLPRAWEPIIWASVLVRGQQVPLCHLTKAFSFS